jgi:drug/metabolite transporter (DMT)-like permease
MKRFIPYLALVCATLFWGANFNVGKFALAHMHPLNIAAWRFLIAAACMCGILALKEGFNFPSIGRNLWLYSIMGLVGIFGFNAMFFYGLRLTSSVNGSLIMALNPTITVILSSLVARERITARQILGLTLSMVGVVVVVTRASLQALLGLHFSWGEFIILIGNVCWATYAVIGKRFLRNVTALQTTAVTMVFGACFLGALAGLQGSGQPFVEQPTPVILSVVFMAVFGSVLAYFWWNSGIAKIGAARTAVFFDLVPIWTMLIAVSVGEEVSSIQLLGSVLVISGVLFSSGVQFRAPAAKVQPAPAPAPALVPVVMPEPQVKPSLPSLVKPTVGG